MTDDVVLRPKARGRSRKSKNREHEEIGPLYLETTEGKRRISLPSNTVLRYRHLYTRLVRTDPLPRRLGIIAALREEGVTTLALELAAVMAHDMEARFCVVETNFWWPGLAARLQMEPAPGLAQVVQGECALDAALRPTTRENLWLFPAGISEEGSRPRMAQSRAMRETLDTLAEQFDHLVMDIPAVLATDDAVPLAGLADALCLLVRQRITPLPLVREALDQVEHLSIRGVVLSGERMTVPRWLLRLIGGKQVR